jgi:hypothetical protein
VEAYVFAKDIGITTMSTVDTANLEWTLIRSHMAKMISNFAIKIMQTSINTWINCSFGDMNKQSQEMQTYVNLACQLGLMWIGSDGNSLLDFRPDDKISRAEFGTILSRLLRGTKYEWWSPYYKNHLNALQKAEIMTKVDKPSMQELRGRTMLMMERIYKIREQ